jgi:uncharacterized MAPEG superfamily protein
MQELLQQSSFRIYAAVCALLIIKMILLALATGITRGPRKASINPEDSKHEFGKADEVVDRICRAHTNAVHNILPFAVVGLLYVMMGASTSGLQIYAYTFFTARVLHTIFYLFKLQPFRTLSFAVGALCIIGMSTQVIMRAFA